MIEFCLILCKPNKLLSNVQQPSIGVSGLQNSHNRTIKMIGLKIDNLKDFIGLGSRSQTTSNRLHYKSGIVVVVASDKKIVIVPNFPKSEEKFRGSMRNNHGCHVGRHVYIKLYLS